MREQGETMDNSFMQDLLAVLRDFYANTMQFLPRLLGALIIIALGWALALALKKLVRRALVAAKFDKFCETSGMGQLFRRADLLAPPSELAGRCLFWTVWIVFLMSAVSALGVDAFSRLATDFFGYLPHILAALLIVLIGFLLGNFLARAAVLATVNAGFASAHLVGSAVRLLIAVFAFAMALDQLQIARNIVTAGFAIAFGALMLGAALAFGLGGRDVARKVLEERLLARGKNVEDELSHI
jgi:hypothetical protein